MASFNWPATGGGVAIYANLAAFPTNGAPTGNLSVAADTGILYEWNGAAWVALADPAVSAGAITSLTGDVTGTGPGATATTVAKIQGTTVSGTTGTGNVVFSASPTFTGSVTAPTFIGTLTGHASLDVATSSLGNLTDAGTDGIVITGGTGATVGNVSIAQHVADTTHSGYLSSTDWNTFNGKGAGTVTSFAFTNGSNITGTVTNASSTPTLSLAPTTTTATASYFSSWDANKNLSANNYFNGAAALAKTGGTTTMDITYAAIQYATGATNQTIKLPTTSVPMGATYTIINGDSGSISMQSSSGASIGGSLNNGFQMVFTANKATPTLAADWMVVQSATNGTAPGSVTSVGLSVPATSLFGVGGTPVTGSGTLALNTTGTSGGIAYFSSTSQMASSGLMAQYGVMLGGGAGATPVTLATNASTAFPLVSGGSSANPSWAGLTVGGGGTGLTSGTSGGIPYFSSTSAMTSSALLTQYGVIYGGGAGASPVATANGTTGQAFVATTSSPPGWGVVGAAGVNTATFTAPTTTTLTATGSQTGWLFQITPSVTLAVGDTYTNNSNTYTVLVALSAQSGVVLLCSGTGATSGGTLTKSVSASGPATIAFTNKYQIATYTTPTSGGRSPLWLEVEASGGGGGGGAATVNNGASGGVTYFGQWSAIGGVGGTYATGTYIGGLGGSGGVGTAQYRAPGGGGASGGVLTSQVGGPGGSGYFGGAGAGSGYNNAGIAGIANTGGGGSGGNNAGTIGCGGGAGEYFRVTIGSPAATYPYIIGTGGAGGAAGGFKGGDAGSGVIIIREHYQ